MKYKKILPMIIYFNILPMILSSFVIGLNYDVLVIISYIITNIYILWIIKPKLINVTVNKKNVLFWLLILLNFILLMIKLLFTSSILFLDVINIIITLHTIIFYYIVFNILKKSSNIDEILNELSKTLLTIIAFSIIINLITNYKEITNIMIATNSYSMEFKSFFSNRNVYGQFLLFSVVLHKTILKKYNKKQFRNLLPFIYISIGLTFSRTTIATLFIFILVDALMAKKWCKVLILFLLPLVLLWFPNLFERLDVLLFRTETGTAGRSNLWNQGFKLILNKGLVLGTGKYAAIKHLKDIGIENSQFHNFYIEALIFGGIYYLSTNLLVIKLVVKKSFKTLYQKEVLSIMIVFLTYSLFESVSFFRLGFSSTIITIFIIILPLLAIKNYNTISQSKL